jgi:DNA-binding CsgD family transcriptional regulator
VLVPERTADSAGGALAIDEPRGGVGTLELPLLLVVLDDLTVKAISRAALKGLGVPPAAIVGHPIVDLASDARRSHLQNVLEAVRAGGIDAYRAHGILGAGSRSQPFTAWVEAFRFEGGPVALVQIAHGIERQHSPLAEYLGRTPLAMAVGTVDPSWVITSMSADVETLVGMPADDVVGRRLVGWVDERDVRTLLDAGRMAHRENSTVVRVRVRDGSGGWTSVCCVLTSLAGSMDLCLFLLPVPEPAAETGDSPEGRGRVAQLEEHLRRIAAEVEASGASQRWAPIPDLDRFPQLGGLSSRQSEVLHRLVLGQRVPIIARELYLSQSTVRNHLAAIFERFDVHSQAELLAVFAEARSRPT